MTTSPIASRLPGRLRLRAPDLRSPLRNEALRAELAGWEGVISAEGNPVTGSILLRYEAAHVRPEDMEARVVKRFAELSGVTESQTPDEPPQGATLWEVNRYAKIGMLGSLTASLLALASGKRLHAAFGGLHLMFLMLHLARHRKRILQ